MTPEHDLAVDPIALLVDPPPPARPIDGALLTKALEYITAHPEQWNQRSWVRRHPCGTTACLAGTVVQLAGHDIDWQRHVDTLAKNVYGASLTTDGQRIEDLARELLGLDVARATLLFHFDTDEIGTLWRRVARVTDGAVVVPPQFQRAFTVGAHA